MLYAGNGWFQSDSPQENFYPENLGPFKYTQYFPPSDGEITSKFIMAFDTVIPFFQAWLPSLYLPNLMSTVKPVYFPSFKIQWFQDLTSEHLDPS